MHNKCLYGNIYAWLQVYCVNVRTFLVETVFFMSLSLSAWLNWWPLLQHYRHPPPAVLSFQAATGSLSMQSAGCKKNTTKKMCAVVHYNYTPVCGQCCCCSLEIASWPLFLIKLLIQVLLLMSFSFYCTHNYDNINNYCIKHGMWMNYYHMTFLANSLPIVFILNN